MSFHYSEFRLFIKGVSDRISAPLVFDEARDPLPKLAVQNGVVAQAKAGRFEEWTFEAHIGEMRRLGAV